MGGRRTRRARIKADKTRQRRIDSRLAPRDSAAGDDSTSKRWAREPSPFRRWLFRGVIFVLPWLLLLLLEISLRIFGYGAAMDFALRRNVAGEPRLVNNPHFTWLFFEPNAARLCPPFSLAVRKPPNTYRVFVLGASAAQGDPGPGFGLARMLEVLLRHQYPGVDFEMINAAPTAINSHVVYRMARDCAALAPDMFIVYLGNNEVVGPYGTGTVLTPTAPNLTILRAGLALRSTRLGQLVGATIRHATNATARGRRRGAWRGMEMFVDHNVRHDDPLLQRTYRLFERNLTDIGHVAQRSGIPLVLSTVAVNLRSCAPFGSLNAATLSRDKRLRWDDLYREGVRLQEARRWADAMEWFRRASRIDDEHAELHYRLGRCAWNLERYGEAGRRYRQARNLDTLRFRADIRINEIIRNVASREASRGVHLVDAARRLEGQAPHGMPGEEAFLDHVHMSFTGTYLVGMTMLGKIREVLPDWVRRKDSGGPTLSEQECARRLVFTDLDRYMLAEIMLQRIRQPPFTGQMDHSEHVARFSREIEMLKAQGESDSVSIALSEYEKALAGQHPHWTIRERHAAIQQRIGNLSVAEREWRALIDRYPQHPSFHLQLARTLRNAGRYSDAEASFREVLDYQPESTLTLVELAKTVLLQGKTREAIEHSRQAVALDPDDANALYVLATSECHKGECGMRNRAQVIAHLSQALEIAPESDAVRKDLTRALVRQAQDVLAQGDSRNAISLLDRALEIAPGMAEAHENLGLLYQQLDDQDKAVRHLSAALQAEPDRERARRALEELQRM